MSCDLYIIGHEHPTFGHAVKVGIASNAVARLRTFQTGNIEALHLYFCFTFDDRETAAEVERLFHQTEIAGPVRGEWVGCDPAEVLLYLTFITTAVLCRRNRPNRIADARRVCGLLDAFAITDMIPDERQTYINDQYDAVRELVE